MHRFISRVESTWHLLEVSVEKPGLGLGVCLCVHVHDLIQICYFIFPYLPGPPVRLKTPLKGTSSEIYVDRGK